MSCCDRILIRFLHWKVSCFQEWEVDFSWGWKCLTLKLSHTFAQQFKRVFHASTFPLLFLSVKIFLFPSFYEYVKDFFGCFKVLQQYLRRQWPIEQRVTKDSLVSLIKSLCRWPELPPAPTPRSTWCANTREHNTQISKSRGCANSSSGMNRVRTEPAGHWSQWFQTCHLNRTRCTKNIYAKYFSKIFEYNCYKSILPYLVFVKHYKWFICNKSKDQTLKLLKQFVIVCFSLTFLFLINYWIIFSWN